MKNNYENYDDKAWTTNIITPFEAIALLTAKPLTEADLIVGNRFECIEDYNMANILYAKKGNTYECKRAGHILVEHNGNLCPTLKVLNRNFKLLPTTQQESVTDKALKALEEIFATVPKGDMDKIVSEIDEMKFGGVTLKEYFESMQGNQNEILELKKQTAHLQKQLDEAKEKIEQLKHKIEVATEYIYDLEDDYDSGQAIFDIKSILIKLPPTN